MSKFEVALSTNNAAFADDDLGYELARILREVADKVEGGAIVGPGSVIRLFDYNGNRVGFAALSDDDLEINPSLSALL